MLVSYIITIITFTTTNFCKENELESEKNENPISNDGDLTAVEVKKEPLSLQRNLKNTQKNSISPTFKKTLKTMYQNFGIKEFFFKKNKFIVFLYVYCNVFPDAKTGILKVFYEKYENEFKKNNVFADYNLDISFNIKILKFIAENNGEYFPKFLEFSPFFKKFYDFMKLEINYNSEKKSYKIELSDNLDSNIIFETSYMQKALNNIFKNSKLLSKKPDKIIKMSNDCYIVYFDDFFCFLH